MGISRRILATSVVALTTGAAFAATSPADAASPSRAGAAATGPPRMEPKITDIREVLNQRAEEVQFYQGDDRLVLRVAPNSRWAGSMWVPWVGNEGDMGKSITITWGGRTRCWVFQDYWNTTNLVRYSTTDSYQQSFPVPGASTGAGRKRLLVRSDGFLSMENST